MRVTLRLLPFMVVVIGVRVVATEPESAVIQPLVVEKLEIAPQPRAKLPAVDYQRDISPILEAKCNRCHTAKKADGKLITTTPAALLKGGASGPAIEPGKPDKSILIELIHFNEMPPKRVQPRVTAEELKLLKAWIAAGAKEK